MCVAGSWQRVYLVHPLLTLRYPARPGWGQSSRPEEGRGEGRGGEGRGKGREGERKGKRRGEGRKGEGERREEGRGKCLYCTIRDL